MYKYILITVFVSVSLFSLAQKKKTEMYNPEVIETNINGTGYVLEIEFYKGPEIYYPLMAIWIEDSAGNYIQDLYVAESIAKGVFNYGKIKDNRWVKESKRRPAALPYWGHKRNIKAEDGLYLPTANSPIADAYTGATPTSDFILKTKSDKKLPGKFKILFEINQSWDWNQYWTNNKYPDDEDYKTSAQPALVYEAEIDMDSDKKEYEMYLIGHSHYSGKTGELFTDLSTFTTALEITNKIVIKIKGVSKKN